MLIKTILKRSSFLFIVLAGILVGSIGYAAVSPMYSQKESGSNTNFPMNEFGESYGSAKDVPYEKLPDLIKAIGIDGKQGYVRKTELEGPNPKTPEEALALQAKDNTDRYINVYESDGKTIIDKYKILSASETLRISSERQKEKEQK